MCVLYQAAGRGWRRDGPPPPRPWGWSWDNTGTAAFQPPPRLLARVSGPYLIHWFSLGRGWGTVDTGGDTSWEGKKLSARATETGLPSQVGRGTFLPMGDLVFGP